MKIASRLAKLEVNDLNSLFGVFAKQERYITKDNFKYTIIHTLRVPINERELDMLLKTNSYVSDKDFIDSEDFKMLFSGPLGRAR
jgi:hypothetical protein